LIALISLEAAKQHLRVEGADFDEADLHKKIAQASAIVLNHLKIDTLPDEGIPSDPPTGPAKGDAIEAAALLVLGELWEQRESTGAEPLSEGVRNLLIGLRDPSLA